MWGENVSLGASGARRRITCFALWIRLCRISVYGVRRIEMMTVYNWCLTGRREMRRRGLTGCWAIGSSKIFTCWKMRTNITKEITRRVLSFFCYCIAPVQVVPLSSALPNDGVRACGFILVPLLKLVHRIWNYRTPEEARRVWLKLMIDTLRKTLWSTKNGRRHWLAVTWNKDRSSWA